VVPFSRRSGRQVTRPSASTARTAEGVSTLDVTDGAAVEAFGANLDALAVLVNAAGVISLRAEYDPSEFARVVDINLTGTMRMAVACRAALAKARGSVVNIASMHAIFGAPLSPAYSASKGGIVQLTKSLAIAWAEDGHPRQCACAWLDRNAHDRAGPVRRRAPSRDPGPHAARPVGHAG
jgi:NAD(P)-dependent dehydrogenase (short-subunit alcohol dehydrogenase family)